MDPQQLKQFLLDLGAQDDCYLRMLAQTESQLRRLDEGVDAAALGAMLAEKQALMADLEALEVRLAPGKQQWPQWRAQLAPEVAAFADKRLAALQESLRRLIDAEEKASKLVAERMLGNREKIAGLARKGAANRAYAGARPENKDARFLDVQ